MHTLHGARTVSAGTSMVSSTVLASDTSSSTSSSWRFPAAAPSMAAIQKRCGYTKRISGDVINVVVCGLGRAVVVSYTKLRGTAG
eukprot:25051-Eustigmatos_ZCMA.PRE.1